ncbi:MAG: leucine-rich repeat domain-containing protein, partial [Candidatus Poribacteria bacterium]|nr:leucine-rich repeat domain-containing protein [Candidatus Poribacteria bacterium]
MNRKLFSIGLACLIALFLIPHFGHAQEKITGPWLWMIAPTEPEQGGAESIDIDSLAVASGGAVTEADVAANGANEGDRVGNYVWTLGQISATGGDNINECLNQIGLTDGNVDNHSSYALFTLNSETVRNGVTMHVGSDDAIKVWLNGVVVHNHPVNRGASDFQDAFPINLVAGDNLLMVKVSELGGGWSMFVGIDTATTYVGIDAVSGVSSDDGQIQDPDVRRPIVQVVYRPVPGSAPRPNVNAEIDGLIKKVQRFFADEMERHGFGRKTFQIEVDASGNSVVHRGELYNPGKNFFVYMEGGNQVQVQGICGYGGPSDWEGHAGHATIYCWDWKVVAHELGHAFGLPHDFRAGSDRYIMSYGGGARRQLSDGAAEWLDAHRAFNPATGKSATNERTKIEMLPPSFAAPPNAIRLRFKVNDTDGLHQAQLLTPTLTGLAAGSPELLNYKGLNGSTNTTVEFVTGLTPNNLSVSLLVIDVHSNFTIDEFPIDVTSLLPRSKGVSIPDANLAAAVRQTLRLSSSETITTHAMLNLSELDVSNSGITDLTGLEHAHNLRSLNLGNEFIEGDGFVNSRTVLDLSPLSGLTNLTSLQLSGNNISDIAAISALKNLDTLDLSSNNISDVSPLSGLTNLTSLNLSSNNISDLAALSTLTNLTSLGLSSNNISDVSPLSELAYLTSLWLSSNNISDVSPLSGLTNL